jgi:Tfp pilus assembly protein PilV
MRLARAVRGRCAPREGISLVEVIVALMLLGGGLVGVTSSGVAVISQMKVSRTEVELWAALQTVGDSLQQLGHGNVSDCPAAADGTPCRVIDRYGFNWTVTSPQPNLNVLTIAGSVSDPVLRTDTMLVYLADF